MEQGDDDVAISGLFKEIEEFSPQEKPAHFAEYTLKTGQILHFRLVGHSPLWGHVFWNAARVAADFLQDKASDLVHGKDILELGAGAGVPSLVCASLGARRVAITDYPETDLIENIRHNVQNCPLLSDSECSIAIEGHLWGQPFASSLGPPSSFDLLILADLVFNHSEHRKLVKTIQVALKNNPDSKALVFFTPHRPWLLGKDLAFFTLAEQAGFKVVKLMEKLMDRPMYDEDRGDETLRRTVFGYEIKWKQS